MPIAKSLVLLATIGVGVLVPRVDGNGILAQCPEVKVGFELIDLDCGDVIRGVENARIAVEAFATVETCEGTQGWAIGFKGVGADIQFDRSMIESCGGGCAQETIGAPTAFNSPLVVDPRLVPDDGPLAGKPQGSGVIDGVLLQFGQRLPGGVSRMIRFRFFIRIPSSPEQVRLVFLDGLQGPNLPVVNGFVINGDVQLPTAFGECWFTVAPFEGIGKQFPGDCNQDTLIDISDGICFLSHLFLGNPATLPCGNGTTSDVANANLLDFNGDDRADVSDPVALLVHLFLGGAGHALGESCVTIPGCANRCER